ncbi:hypothetical protein QUE93_11555, partial [Leuconostoc falkenbergense]|nr:hypothetical protein [Leuconostoc falkenbergense]
NAQLAITTKSLSETCGVRMILAICHIHVRPHSKKAAYNYGNPNGNKLPAAAVWTNKHLLSNPQAFSDEWMTTQSFWVNKSLLESEVKKANILNN